jgi:photosystem II stability/assembly factor-like uncharacterized protein
MKSVLYTALVCLLVLLCVGSYGWISNNASGADGNPSLQQYLEPCKDEILDSIYRTNILGDRLSLIREMRSVVCGDADGSGAVDIDDVVYLIAFIFSQGPPPVPEECVGDADGSGAVDIDDAVYLVSYVLASGPAPIASCCGNSDQWESIGPYDGNAPTTIECSPTNGDTLYAGTNGHSGIPEALYRSTDRGGTWSTLLEQECNSLAIDPTDPYVIYAGMVNDMLKSADGGNTWDTLEAENLYPYFWVSKIIGITIDPVNSNIVYACASDVFYGYFLFVSPDAGATWTMVLHCYENPGIRKLAIDPQSPQMLYGAVQEGGIYKSTDGGSTWQWMNTGITDFTIFDIEVGVVPDRGRETTVFYVATLDSGVFYSDDGAQKWYERNNGLSSLQVTELNVVKQDADVVFAGTADGVFKSEDGGLIWTPTGELPIYHFNSSGGPADSWILGLKIDEVDPNTIYTSHFDIMYQSLDGGDSWDFVGLPITQITTIEASPYYPGAMYCGARYGYGDFYKTANGGTDWLGWIPPEPGPYDVTVVKAHPDDSNSIYLTGYNMGGGFYRSYDAGETWVQMNNGLDETKDRCIEDVAFDPADGETVYIGALNGVFKSTNGGIQWQETGLTIETIHVLSIATHPTRSDIVYAGTYGEGFHRSNDAGDTWTALDTGIEDGVYLVIATDPNDPDAVYTGTMYNGILRSPDTGDTWEPVNTGLGDASIRAILVYNPSPVTTDLYVGTWGEGVFRSTDYGAQWNPMDMEAMTVRKVTSLEYTLHFGDGLVLYVGTYGGGIFRRNVD